MRLSEEVKKLEDKLETASALITCCCGSPVDSHGMGDGHSPVDMYHYRLTKLEEQNEILIDALRWYANKDIYKPHPNGIAFDDRDLSFFAVSKLKEAGITD